MVKVAGFEPAVSASQAQRDTGLHYTLNRGLGGETRTRVLMLPKHAWYQLHYTQIIEEPEIYLTRYLFHFSPKVIECLLANELGIIYIPPSSVRTNIKSTLLLSKCFTVLPLLLPPITLKFAVNEPELAR